jgi:hypothetical protein
MRIRKRKIKDLNVFLMFLNFLTNLFFIFLSRFNIYYLNNGVVPTI